MDPNTPQQPSSLPEVPRSVVDPNARRLYSAINLTRAELKHLAERVDGLRRAAMSPRVEPEAIANLTIAYRAIEDASMRLGKSLQALDGGVSVYDKATTVDTPRTTPAL